MPCCCGVVALSTAVVGTFIVRVPAWGRWLLALAGIVFIAPSPMADLVALAICAPVLLLQITGARQEKLAGA